jgi:hypothetical protein
VKRLAVSSLLIAYAIVAATPCDAFAIDIGEPHPHSHHAASGDPLDDRDASPELRRPCACGCDAPQAPGNATQRLPVGLLTSIPTPAVHEGDTAYWVHPARRVVEIVAPLDPVPI